MGLTQTKWWKQINELFLLINYYIELKLRGHSEHKIYKILVNGIHFYLGD